MIERIDLCSASLNELAVYYKAAFAEYQQMSRDIFGSAGGGLIYDAAYLIERMLEGAQKIVPFKKGDVVELISTPVIDEATAWGWMGSKHFLVAGAHADVYSIQLGRGGWELDLNFHDESWISSLGEDKGKINVVAPDNRHIYSFNARDVRKVEP